MVDGAPRLPDGLVAVVKRDCATCCLVVPVLGELAARGRTLTVYTQDDPATWEEIKANGQAAIVGVGH